MSRISYEPVELKNYGKINHRLREKVNSWMTTLDESCREFVELRYVKALSLTNISEVMNYEVRSLYNLRRKVFESWNDFSNSDILDEHQERLLTMIHRNVTITHSRLLKNFNLGRHGLTVSDFEYMIDNLILNGHITCIKEFTGKKALRVYFANDLISNSSSEVRQKFVRRKVEDTIHK